MKRRIFWFHMATLLLALVTLLVVAGGSLHLVFRLYQQQSIPAADSRSAQVQDTLNSWPEDSSQWKELDQQLDALHYQLVVERNHHVLYSSLDGFQWEL